MHEFLISPWNENEVYLKQRDTLLRAKGTLCADAFLELPGFQPSLMLTAGAAELIRRASYPCPPRILLQRRRRALTFLINRVWGEKRMGAYAGHFQRSDFLVEAMIETLVLDDGEPTACNFAFVLFEENLLMATNKEFLLEEDFLVERILLRSRLPLLNGR